MQTVHELIDKLNKEHALEKEEWVFLLGHRTEEDAEYLFFLREKAAAEIFRKPCIHERADRVYEHLPERLLLLRDTKEQSECGALSSYDRTDLILRKERV